MQFSSMSPRKRHSSGTVITINHNLLPVHMSLSTPFFNFIKHNQVFCTPELPLRFRNLFLFLPKSCFTFCFPIHSLIFHSQHQSFRCPLSAHLLILCWLPLYKTTSLAYYKSTALLSLHEALASNLRGPHATVRWSRTIKKGHQCNHSCPVWISHPKVWSYSSSTAEES